MRRALALRCAVLLLCAMSVAGCALGQLQFAQDKRLSFVTPHARKLVRVPFTIRWTMKGFDPVGLDGSSDKHRGVFAVFVDRAPMPAGKNLKWLARSDSVCRRDPRCPDAQYLADRGVHVVTDTAITLSVLPLAPAGVGDEQHYVNVVLLDGTGRRIGESAWYLPFTTRRISS